MPNGQQLASSPAASSSFPSGWAFLICNANAYGAVRHSQKPCILHVSSLTCRRRLFFGSLKRRFGSLTRLLGLCSQVRRFLRSR